MKDKTEFIVELIDSTENVYSDILEEVLPYIISGIPYGETALKICNSLSKLQSSSLQKFLIQTGNLDIKSAIKIINNDLDGDNFAGELNQALTLLKRGRDSFLEAIDKDYNTWGLGILRDNSSIRDCYLKASMSSLIIAFGYKLLKDVKKTDKFFEESKFYFYYHLYHYSLKATQKIKGQTIKSVEFMIESEPVDYRTDLTDIFTGEKSWLKYKKIALKEVIEYYELIQAEEEIFIEMSKSIFGKVLKKKLGINSFKTDTSSGGGKSVRYYHGQLFTSWEPPITNW